MIHARVAPVESPIGSTGHRPGIVARVDDGEARNPACAESATTTHQEQPAHVECGISQESNARATHRSREHRLKFRTRTRHCRAVIRQHSSAALDLRPYPSSPYRRRRAMPIRRPHPLRFLLVPLLLSAALLGTGCEESPTGRKQIALVPDAQRSACG
ncbi:hypothetical protein [Thiocapsa rosea]|uniref:Uncharacterized protein n=1 Tax=Thiocapsa rosea TaxID=69360 RepID=A0A495VAF0_9GAMM|nr:hypothetical protein [Thiocapsa rosea]RKT45435.1 hypothetical protein BDD21_2885 [Thiocapsa rosea]